MGTAESVRSGAVRATSAPDFLPAFPPAVQVAVQLEPGRLQAQACTESGSQHQLAVGSVSHALALHGAVGPDHVLIAAILGAAAASSWCGREQETGHCVVLAPGTPINLLLRADSRFAFLHVSAGLFRSTCLSLGLRQCHAATLGPGLYEASLSGPQRNARSLAGQEARRRRARWLRMSCGVPVRTGLRLSELLLRIEANWHGDKCAVLTRARQRVLARAITSMASWSTPMTSIAALAAQCNTSQRGLEYAFQAGFHVSPSRFAKLARLGAAQSALISHPQASIASVARALHFRHLGKFAADYADHFGELPSESACWSKSGSFQTGNAKPVLTAAGLWKAAAHLAGLR